MNLPCRVTPGSDYETSFLEPRSGSLKVQGVLLIGSSTKGGGYRSVCPYKSAARAHPTFRPRHDQTLGQGRGLSRYLRISWFATL